MLSATVRSASTNRFFQNDNWTLQYKLCVDFENSALQVQTWIASLVVAELASSGSRRGRFVLLQLCA